MCGINGFTSRNKKLISEMNDITKHRGPDYSGVYIDDNVSFGHNLLSIRGNIENSKQPFHKRNSDWVLLFNGQIYNTKQIIEKYLSNLSFKKNISDTEIMYALIEKVGWDFIEKIQGMFAIVLYNKKEQIIKLYRDSTGQKGLYYKLKDGILYFSSEIKGLKIVKNLIPKEADKLAINVATYLGYIPGKLTLFKKVYKIEPSQIITFNIKNKKLKLDYFNSTDLNYYKDSKDIFSDLVKEHLLSNYPVAINLSGGLDSSILLYEMSKLKYQINSYTTKFDIKDDYYNSDARVAKRLSKDFKTNHTEILITKKSYLENFKEAILLIEEPNYNISLSVYLQIAEKEGIFSDKRRVVFSGDGGDEIFGGYEEYVRIKKLRSLQFLITPYIFNYLKFKFGNLKVKIRYQNILYLWFSFRRLAKPFITKKNYFSLLRYLEESCKDYFNNYKRRNNLIYKAMLYGRVFWLAGENFIRSDKIYMKNSIELRSPFSYQPFRDHFDLSLKKYINKKNNKLYLRNYYKQKLPKYVLEKEKTGWKSPLAHWYDDEFKNYILKIISEVENNNYLVNWKEVKTYIEGTNKWPGKEIHLYLSLAVLSKEYDLLI